MMCDNSIFSITMVNNLNRLSTFQLTNNYMNEQKKIN